MRKNNVRKGVASRKATDVMQQISKEGIVENGRMSTVADGSVRTVSDEAFDNYEEQLIADHNSATESQIESWNKKMEETASNAEKIKEMVKDIDIRPWGIYVLVKPFDANPFTRMRKLDNGFIVPEFDNHYKSQDTGDIEEMQRFSIFAMVVEVSPDSKGIKKGDIIMYNRHEGIPIPFYGQGFEVVANTHIKCVIGNHDDLERRWEELSQGNS